MTKTLTLPLLLGLASFGLTACGDKEEEGLKKACPTPAPAMKSPPTLPGKFPGAPGVVYTGIAKSGPATVVSGYLPTAIGPAHDAYAGAIKGASGYRVTKEEQDKADAEVNFAGAGNSGQVKLLQTCKARTRVTITIRPA